MATFTYPGGSGTHNFPNNSGVFLCSQTKTDGTGTQTNGVLLQYGQTKTLKRYRDASTIVFMGRTKPATETGQYNFKGFDMTYSWPANSLDWNGNAITAAAIETFIHALTDFLQAGYFIQVQDTRGRNLVGTWTTDPSITDERADSPLGPMSQTVSMSFMEIG